MVDPLLRVDDEAFGLERGGQERPHLLRRVLGGDDVQRRVLAKCAAQILPPWRAGWPTRAYTWQVSLREYHDEFIEAELGDQFGTYLKSFSAAGGLVEVHLFRDPDDRHVAFVTKAASIPVQIAQQLAREALHVITAIQGAAPRVVIDAGSIATSGSL